MQVVFEKIENIETVPYEGMVYNLTTDTEEYVAEGIIVHNCPHFWDIRPNKVTREECPLLWMGE